MKELLVSKEQVIKAYEDIQHYCEQREHCNGCFIRKQCMYLNKFKPSSYTKLIDEMKLSIPNYHFSTNDKKDYWQNITKIKDRQTEKGIKEYGHTLEHSNLSFNESIVYTQEELIDALMYLEKLKENAGKEKIPNT